MFPLGWYISSLYITSNFLPQVKAPNLCNPNSTAPEFPCEQGGCYIYIKLMEMEMVVAVIAEVSQSTPTSAPGGQWHVPMR